MRWNIDALTEKNYTTWSVQVEAALTLDGLWEAIAGVAGADKEVVDAAIDQQAKSVLILVAGPDHCVAASQAQTARAFWDALAAKYNPLCETRQLLVTKDIQDIKIAAGESVAQYVERGQELRFELIRAGGEMSDAKLQTYLTRGLSKTFSPGLFALATLRDVTMDAYRLKVQETADLVKSTYDVDYMKIVPPEAQKPSRAFTAGHGQRKPLVCDYCDERGHKQRFCFKRINDEGTANANAIIRGTNGQPNYIPNFKRGTVSKAY